MTVDGFVKYGETSVCSPGTGLQELGLYTEWLFLLTKMEFTIFIHFKITNWPVLLIINHTAENVSLKLEHIFVCIFTVNLKY